MRYIIREQRPSGGCTNCGGRVRTRKADGWVCATCQGELARRLTRYVVPLETAAPAALSELELRYREGDR